MTKQSVSQPITYRSVAILRPGVFIDANGNSVSFTDESLQRIADNYDPAYHCAVLNLDHNETGPAQGIVSDLTWDGVHLLADLTGVPPELSQALGAGRYPCRSAEVYADLDGRGPYLRAVALLGARPPAVKGLPPMPQAESSCQLTVGSCQQKQLSVASCQPDRYACSYMAQRSGLITDNCQLTTPSIHLRSNDILSARPTPRTPHIITVFTEVSMPVNDEQQDSVLAEPAIPPEAQASGPVSTSEPAAPAPPMLQAPAAPGPLTPVPADTVPPSVAESQTIRLAEENQRLQADAIRLAEENRLLKFAQRQREVRFFLAELRSAGQLTPALERAGVEQALLAAGELPLSVTLPGRSAVPLAELLRELLKALPVSFTFGETAPTTSATAPAFTADDQAVMAALGLSAEEYKGS
jgi:hypothetical protein